MKSRQVFLGFLALLAWAGTRCSMPRAAVEPPPSPFPFEQTQPPAVTAGQVTEVTEVTEVPEPTQLPTGELAQTELPPASTQAPASPPARLEPCQQDVCILEFDFPLERPIASPGRMTIDPSYRFETSDNGKRDPHHGVEFLNSQGTPVLAAADGEVVVAGDDLKTTYGYFPNMYGNLVVLKHDFPGIDEPVFTLYGHLYAIHVEVGDTVKAGDKIGEVGRTGSATGSHLHFEVRYGENTYAASRNPELWLQPLAGEDGQPMGALAGRALDAQDNLLVLENIVVELLEGSGSPRVQSQSLPPMTIYYLNTYSENKMVGLQPWEESFGIGDLPPGEYQISFFANGMQQRTVQVEPGKLTLVTFRIGN